MNKKSPTGLLVVATITVIGLISAIPPSTAQSQVKFICNQSYELQSDRRFPTTFAWTSRGKTAVIRWVKNLGGYSPQDRCQDVSSRFQQAFDNKTLNLITNGKVKGKPVICTAKEYGGACETVLMTLRPEENSLRILNELKDILDARQVGPIKHSSGIPQVYYQIDIEEFLRNAPVEK
ncbi:COP23 domain-containing protein [Calothrix sp. PCC 6303]|uniref:COP23 domain-containing protein n=1 Tax=Calothrix sp. PCC 6303 TaxID=1170562 RepID=UPI0005A142B7|nr:COP23 domain-containing protein [Calothrix sp. PCC 6303]